MGGDPAPAQTPNNAVPAESLNVGSPDLFKPYEQYMPSEYSSNKPIYDPTAILQAYTRNLPEFQKASRTKQLTPASTTNGAGGGGGGDGGVNDILSLLFFPFGELF